MPKKSKKEVVVEEEEELQQAVVFQQLQAQSSSNDKEFRMGVIALAKEILERNAMLQWEQNKTRGLSVTTEEIIEEAKKLMAFIDGTP